MIKKKFAAAILVRSLITIRQAKEMNGDQLHDANLDSNFMRCKPYAIPIYDAKRKIFIIAHSLSECCARSGFDNQTRLPCDE
jgi:hypothetical protein